MNNRSRRMISWWLRGTFLLFVLFSPIHLHAETKNMGSVILTASEGGQTDLSPEKSQENNQEAPKGMVKVDGGQATKSPEDGKKAPVHPQTFYIDQNEVTYSQYERIMGEPPPGRYAGGESPVLSITYQQAKEYCSRVGKRLPYEMEWEMAGRAGYRWHNPWGHYHHADSYRRGYGTPWGYPSAEYPSDGYGIYGKRGAWSYGPTDDFSVYRDSHYSDDVYSKYGLRCAQ